MPNAVEAYKRLERRFHDIAVLGDTIRMLHWDQATMMPPRGAEARSEQLARLEVLRHERLTAPDVATLLADAEAGAAGLDPWQSANLREMRRIADHGGRRARGPRRRPQPGELDVRDHLARRRGGTAISPPSAPSCRTCST